MHKMLPLLEKSNFPQIARQTINTLQVNLGYTCNQTCLHCHVNAGPNRKEQMDDETIDLVIDVLRERNITTLDLTGGAPELNVHFRRLVVAAREMGIKVIDRCNLTILSEPNQEDLAEFLAAQQVEVVASLPCYTEDNVDEQRGNGVFQASIAGLQMLNALGYGDPDTDLSLNLVYNPIGPHLPPSQMELKSDYKKHLKENFNIVFDDLFTITNMPISRFGSTLVSRGQFHEYMNLLRDAYLEQNLDSVMCREIVSVDYNGDIYDCDFNQMLDLPIENDSQLHLRDLLDSDLADHPIRVAEHCYGCTAGQGSSCGGSLN